MKLRIKGNSLRVRVSRSEVTRLLAGDCLEETIYFTQDTSAKFAYALRQKASLSRPAVQYKENRIVILLPTDLAINWGVTDQVGIAENIALGKLGSLQLLIEKRLGMPVGNWLSAQHGKRLLRAADVGSLRGKRDFATLAILLGCGLRRAELTTLRAEEIQQREEHWVIADLVGKGGGIRTVPVPEWVKAAIDSWMEGSGIADGVLLRSINKAGRVWGDGFSPKVIWGVVKEKAKICEIPALAPHDLRRTCARLCHQAGGELEQIQFLLGHVSVQTTERYLGCKQRFRDAVKDRIGLEPDPQGAP
jgi:integrase